MISDDIDYTDAQMLRNKAEEKLKQMQNSAEYQDKEADVQKLLHELQVHQIELEMQNEELKQAYEISEAALKKYTLLYDFAPMGYITLDANGSICDLNFTAAEMLNEKRFSLLNSSFKLFVADESKTVFDIFFRRVSNSNFKESCKIKLGYDNKFLCYVYIEGISTGDEGQSLLSVIDIAFFNK